MVSVGSHGGSYRPAKATRLTNRDYAVTERSRLVVWESAPDADYLIVEVSAKPERQARGVTTLRSDRLKGEAPDGLPSVWISSLP